MTTTSRYAFIAVFLIVGFMMPGIAAIRLASPAQQLHKELDSPAAAEMLLERVAKFKNIVSSEVENKRKQHFINQVVDALNTSEAFNHTKVLAVVKEEALKAGLVSDAKALAKGMREAHFGNSLNVGFSVLNRMPSTLQIVQRVCSLWATYSGKIKPEACENYWMLPKIAVSVAAFINWEFAASKFIPCLGIYPHAFFLRGPAWALRGVDFFLGIANKANVPGASFAYDGNYDFESKKPLCPRLEFDAEEYQDEIFQDGLWTFFEENFNVEGILQRELFPTTESKREGIEITKRTSQVERVCFKITQNLNGKTIDDDDEYGAPDTQFLEGEERKAALEHIFELGGFDPRGCVPWDAARANVKKWFAKRGAGAATGATSPYPLVLKSFVVLTEGKNKFCYAPDGESKNDNSVVWSALSTASVGIEHTAASPPDLIEIYAAMCFQGTTQGGECIDRVRPGDPWAIVKPSKKEEDDKEEWWTLQRVRQLDDNHLADLKLPFWDNKFTLDIGTYGWTWCANETDGSLSSR